MLFTENLYNRSLGFSALVIREETPYPILVGCLTACLPQITLQHSVVVDPCNDLILLLAPTDGPALPCSPLRLGTPHQARMYNPLLEVHPPGDPLMDILFPAEAQRLFKNDVDGDKGPLRVPTPTENPLLFLCQYCSEAVPHCA